MLIYDNGIKLNVVSGGMDHKLVGVDCVEPEFVKVLEWTMDHFAPNSVVKKRILGKSM